MYLNETVMSYIKAILRPKKGFLLMEKKKKLTLWWKKEGFKGFIFK